jgi:hypothetical protein
MGCGELVTPARHIPCIVEVVTPNILNTSVESSLGKMGFLA